MLADDSGADTSKKREEADSLAALGMTTRKAKSKTITLHAPPPHGMCSIIRYRPAPKATLKRIR
jgi:hypothetical protein